jgi:hypothetical protein
VLKVLDEQQLNSFFGPMERLVVKESEDILVECTITGGQLLVQS